LGVGVLEGGLVDVVLLAGSGFLPCLNDAKNGADAANYG
jgi:hypothetical protein